MPGDLDQIIRDSARAEDQPQAFEAVVARTLTAPEQEMQVTLPAFDRRHAFPAIGWTPRVEMPGPTVRYPQKGDRAAVVVSEEAETWCVAWWPGDYE